LQLVDGNPNRKIYSPTLKEADCPKDPGSREKGEEDRFKELAGENDPYSGNLQVGAFHGGRGEILREEKAKVD